MCPFQMLEGLFLDCFVRAWKLVFLYSGSWLLLDGYCQLFSSQCEIVWLTESKSRIKSDTMVTLFFFYNYTDLYTPLPPIYWHIQGNSETGGKQKEDDLLSGDFITVVRQDYFI